VQPTHSLARTTHPLVYSYSPLLAHAYNPPTDSLVRPTHSLTRTAHPLAHSYDPSTHPLIRPTHSFTRTTHPFTLPYNPPARSLVRPTLGISHLGLVHLPSQGFELELSFRRSRTLSSPDRSIPLLGPESGYLSLNSLLLSLTHLAPRTSD
jgi:hypothetical protein